MYSSEFSQSDPVDQDNDLFLCGSSMRVGLPFGRRNLAVTGGIKFVLFLEVRIWPCQGSTWRRLQALDAIPRRKSIEKLPIGWAAAASDRTK